MKQPETPKGRLLYTEARRPMRGGNQLSNQLLERLLLREEPDEAAAGGNVVLHGDQQPYPPCLLMRVEVSILAHWCVSPALSSRLGTDVESNPGPLPEHLPPQKVEGMETNEVSAEKYVTGLSCVHNSSISTMIIGCKMQPLII